MNDIETIDPDERQNNQARDTLALITSFAKSDPLGKPQKNVRAPYPPERPCPSLLAASQPANASQTRLAIF